MHLVILCCGKFSPIFPKSYNKCKNILKGIVTSFLMQNPAPVFVQEIKVYIFFPNKILNYTGNGL